MADETTTKVAYKRCDIHNTVESGGCPWSDCIEKGYTGLNSGEISARIAYCKSVAHATKGSALTEYETLTIEGVIGGALGTCCKYYVPLVFADSDDDFKNVPAYCRAGGTLISFDCPYGQCSEGLYEKLAINVDIRKSQIKDDILFRLGRPFTVPENALVDWMLDDVVTENICSHIYLGMPTMKEYTRKLFDLFAQFHGSNIFEPDILQQNFGTRSNIGGTIDPYTQNKKS